MKKKNAFHFFLGIAISIICLYYAFKNVDFSRIVEESKNIRWMYLWGATGAIIFCNIIRAYRWKYILIDEKDVPLNNLFSSIMVGFMGNNLLPARAGEFMRAYSIGKTSGISKSKAFATIVLERIIDGLTLLLFLVLVLFFYMPDLSDSRIDNIKYAGLAFYVIALAGAVMLKVSRKFTLSVVRKIFGMISENLADKMEAIAESFIKGLDVLHDIKGVAIAVVLSIFNWAVSAWSFDLAFQAFNINLPWYSAYFLLALVGFGMMLPATGGIGPFHMACILGLEVMGISKDVAGAYAIIFHFLNFACYTLIGLWYFYRENMSFDIDMEVKDERVS